MVSQRIEALPLTHLRTVGGGVLFLRHGTPTRLTSLLLALAAGAWAGACRSSAERRVASSVDSAFTVVDDAGRTVSLPHAATRVVSLAPSITELLFAIGAGDHVVGRTTWCKYPPAAIRVPVVGDGLNPSVEAIAARQPDLVVLYRSALTEAAARRLADLGVPALMLQHDRLEDLGRTARLLGRLTGRAAAGDSLAQVLDSVLAQAAPPRAVSRPRLAFVVWDDPPMVIGGGSYLDQIAGLAGADNVFHDLGSASATVGLETIAARDPDWVATLTDSSQHEPPWATRPAWRVIRAVREHRFLALPADLYGRPSPRLAEAVERLHRLLAVGP